MSIKWQLLKPDHNRFLFERGLTGEMLADKLGIKRPYVSMYVNGKPVPKPVRDKLDDYFHNNEDFNIMSKGKFSGIQVNEINDGTAIELIVDFNHQHHGGCIDKSFPKAGVVLLLRQIAMHIENDESIE